MDRTQTHIPDLTQKFSGVTE